MGRQRSALVGPGSRPVSIPDEAAFDGGNQASGVVVLPHHVRWSDPHLSYDLDDRTDRTRAYEQVLREGTVEDVRRFIQVDEVIELWNEGSSFRLTSEWPGRPGSSNIANSIWRADPTATSRGLDNRKLYR